MIITENDRKLAGMDVGNYSQEILDIAKMTGLKPSSVKQYLATKTPEEIINRKLKTVLVYDGKNYTLEQFAKKVGTGKARVFALRKFGLTPEQIINDGWRYAVDGSECKGIKLKYLGRTQRKSIKTSQV